ncbi:MAG: Ig-like domain-containing protein [Elainellaceae cyanobacterium]
MPHQIQNDARMTQDDRQSYPVHDNGTQSLGGNNHLIVGHYNIQIGSIHGGEINIHTAEPEVVQPRSMPVMLLPRPFLHLVGRRDEINEAIASIESGQSVEVYGAPGLGKTVLLRHLAYQPQVTAPFSAGAVYLDAPYQTAPDHLQSLFDAFYDSDPTYKPTVEQIRHYLHAKRALIVLDDQPHGDGETTDPHRHNLESLMNAVPDCVFLLASPDRHLWGEGNSMPLRGLSLNDAIALMEQDLRRSLSDDEIPAAETLWHLLEGHPQDLLYATGHIKVDGVSFDEIIQTIQSSSSRKSLIQHIWSRLSKPQRLVLATLSAVSGIALLTRWVAAMTHRSDLEQDLERDLAALVERNLVVGDGDRYTVHDSLSSVLEEGLNLDPARSQTLTQYTTWAEQTPLTADRVLEEAGGLFYCLDWAVKSGRWIEALRLIKLIEPTLALSKRWGLWAKALDWALLAGRSLSDPAIEAWALHELGSRALCLEEGEAAYTYLSQALEIRERLGDQVGAAVTRHNLNLLLLPVNAPDEPAPVDLPAPYLPDATESGEIVPAELVPPPSATQVISGMHWETEEQSPPRKPAPLRWFIFLLPLIVGGAIAGAVIWFTTARPQLGTTLTANDDEMMIDDSSESFTPVEIDVLANDQTPVAGGFTLLEVSQPRHGTAFIENGTVFYGPEPGFSGIDQFTYLVEDSAGNRDRATVTLIVRPDQSKNTAPEVTNDTASTAYNTPTQIAVLENDRDPDGDELTVTLATPPENGAADVSRDGQTINYIPNDGFSGQDQLTYTVSDRQGGMATGTVTITVNPPQLSAADLTYETRYGTPTTLNVLAENPYPGRSLSVTIAAEPARGTATVNSNNTITYTPSERFSGGSDRFQYRLTTPSGQTATGTVTIQMTDPRLTAPDYQASTQVNAPVRISVLRDNPYPNADNLVIRVETPPQSGTAQPADGGTIVYTPNENFTGRDRFTYQVRDNRGQSATGTVTVEVTSPAPTAPDYTLETPSGEAARLDLLRNNSYPNLDNLSVTISTPPQNGSVELSSGRVAIYQPRQGFSGRDQFQYTVRDPQGRTATGTVAVTVTASTPPSARNDQATTAYATRVSIDVLSNDQNPGGDRLAISDVTSPANGTATISGNSIIYTPTQGFSGQDSFQYTLSDTLGRTDTATVTVTVEPPANRPPNAQDDQVTTPYFQPVSVNLLGNDDDPDGDRLTIIDLTAPQHGSATISGTTVIYSPNRGFSGQDSFRYTVSDGSQAATATITVIVQPEGNQGPI